MKRLIQILLTSILAIGISTTAFAQDNTDNADITGTADVLAAIAVNQGNNLDFGDVQPASSETKTVNANGTDNDTDVTVGSFTVTGTNGASVQLNFTALPDLTDGSGNTLTIDYANTNYALWSTDGDNTTTGDNSPFDPTTATPTATLDGDGISVFIGGQAQPTNSQVAGNYTGTITLEATYN